jgi:heme/copper-type cytochrome/quinol oxidase subunit 1
MYDERLAVTSFVLTFVGTAITFFPMHIVGLLGMTRRVYTYNRGLGWDTYNLVETVGGFTIAAGLLLILVNIFWSARRGAPSGRDPFGGGTLEWTVPSPPPAYNFAVIPTVTSAYPNWDDRDTQGVLVLDAGHQTPVSTVNDAELTEVGDLPAESAAPILVALPVTLVFAFLLTSHWVTAGIFGFIALLALAGWHAHEPEPA